ncbi:hypothetical protein EsH8_IX_000723 [Colletotrichum jinshuiense]
MLQIQSLDKPWRVNLDAEFYPTTDSWSLREAGLGLVDIPENENDASLWLSVLRAAKREHGQDGVLAIWDAVKRRKTLYNVTSEGAKLFWNIVLEAVLHREDQLQDAVLFAEWLLHAHSARWPSLYSTVVAYCLRNGQFRRAMQWHLRLIPNFEPGSEAFGAMLREFVVTPEADMQQALQALYITTLHRGLYDELIPLLYQSGLSQQCNEWRKIFIHHHDLPRPTAVSQPYLRFLARYYPTTVLELEEQMVVGLNSPAYWNGQDALWDAMSSTHSDEDGPKGGRHSDTLGARWFASSWVPLDFAIHAAHALGIRQIGPLSLQSIALREPTAKGVKARIEQLRKVNISIGHSAYARVLKRFAENEDNELLSELLHTDIHPDVFDDPATLASIRNKVVSTGPWKTHRLLLAIQPAIAEESVDSTSNYLLQQFVKQGQTKQALTLLDDMRAMNIDISALSVHHICQNIFDVLSWNPEITEHNQVTLQMAITYLARLTLVQKPVHSRYWQKVVFGLGKFGRIGELEQLCFGVLESYQKRCTLEGGLLPVHHLDAPPSDVEGSDLEVLVPADLPITHEHHPIRRMFDNAALHAAIVRWGFKAGLSKGPDRWARVPLDTKIVCEFSAARGVRFLAKLSERGIPFRVSVVREEVVRCLARMYLLQNIGRSQTKLGRPTLEDMSELFNKAAGCKLLPDIAGLRDLMEGAREKMRGRL